VLRALCAAAQAQLRARPGGRAELNAAETSVVGAAAGAVTGLLTTPLDVIKTRLMTQGTSARCRDPQTQLLTPSLYSLRNRP
jgi:hypothetical protein